jgi:threonine dehydrogenase-like Zn-dependent dehydrogenase
MKALVWEAPHVLALRDQPEPTVGAGEVLIRVVYAGICDSELSAYLGHNALRVPPLVMGHEFAGHIAGLGADAAQHNPQLVIGQAVTANPLIACGQCMFCRQGSPHICTRRALIGAHRPGAYAEYVAVPAESVLPMPATLTPATAALAEPAAVAVRIGVLAGDVRGTCALVLGAGPIGLLALQVLRLRGAAQVFIADLAAERRAMAAELGGIILDPLQEDVTDRLRAETAGLGAAVAVDAVGTASTRAYCVSATRSAGTVVLCGLHEEIGVMPAAEIIRREIVVRGSFAYTPDDFTTALSLLEHGQLRLAPWIVEAPLGEGGAWFDRLLAAPGAVAKVLLTP